MASSNLSSSTRAPLQRQHTEPDKPLMYEPPDLRGRKHVEKVAGEYRVREDECLADRLQNEEFELHFGKNKDERKHGHINIKAAKEIYLREVEALGILSKDELKKLCKDDKFIANEVTRRLEEETDLEAQRKAASEMQDEEFARYLEAKEKEKVEQERKRRLQRRIAQDRAAAEKIQRDLEMEASQEEALAKGVKNIQVTSSDQRGGWALEFEPGTTSGAKTKQELQALKDAEIARSLQLKEVESEKKRAEEERDRHIAMKLQRQEAEEYKRGKERVRRERESQRRHHSGSVEEREATSAETQEERGDHRTQRQSDGQSVRKKQLQSVDATGQRMRDAHTPHRQSSERQSNGHIPERQGSDKARHRNSTKREEEPIYLKAVDATGNPVEQRQKTRSKQENYDHERNHEKDHRQERNSQRHRADVEEGRLVDDQRALRNQMRQVDQIGRDDMSSRDNNRRSSKKHQDNSWDFAVETRNRPTEENYYDMPEENCSNNIVQSLDPTYSSIDSMRRSNGGNPGSVRAAAPVIQNVKRQPEDPKKKKKWFSKKEKSK